MVKYILDFDWDYRQRGENQKQTDSFLQLRSHWTFFYPSSIALRFLFCMKYFFKLAHFRLHLLRLVTKKRDHIIRWFLYTVEVFVLVSLSLNYSICYVSTHVPMRPSNHDYLLPCAFAAIPQILRGGFHRFQSNQPKTR